MRRPRTGHQSLDGYANFGQECAMRRTDTSTTMFRTLRLAVVPLSLGLIMASGAARAADERTFSEKMSDSFFGVIRGTNMDSRGIDYRERSPLVVPPTLDLPPPAADAAMPRRTGRRIRTNADARPSSPPRKRPRPRPPAFA